MEIQDRREIEQEIVKKLGWLSQQHREELRGLLGAPPSMNNVPAAWWEKVKEQHAAETMTLLALLFTTSATQHGLDDEQARRLGQEWAEQRSADLANQFVRTTQDSLRTAEQRWQEIENRINATPAPSGEADPKQELEDDVEESLEVVFGDTRNESIAVTETTTAQNQGSETAVDVTNQKSGFDTWITEQDARVCPICSPMHGTPRQFWERYHPDGPPLHPRCRCYIRYEFEG